MILAAPLVIPFAKAVGLSVGTLGMAALADQVNDYIQDNPEESMKINVRPEDFMHRSMIIRVGRREPSMRFQERSQDEAPEPPSTKAGQVKDFRVMQKEL